MMVTTLMSNANRLKKKKEMVEKKIRDMAIKKDIAFKLSVMVNTDCLGSRIA